MPTHLKRLETFLGHSRRVSSNHTFARPLRFIFETVRLEETLELVHATDNQLRQEKGSAPRLQVYMRQMIQCCPASSTTTPIRPATDSSCATTPAVTTKRPFAALFGHGLGSSTVTSAGQVAAVLQSYAYAPTCT